MKVLLINGSPHEKGCTYTALSLIAKELNDAGVDTEILHVGGKPVGGCIGCGGCAAGNGCVFLDENREAVNIIMRNCKACGVFDRSRVNIGEAARYLSACREQFDIVLLDPPFRNGTLEKILPAVDKCTAPGGIVLCESETGIVLPAEAGGLTLRKQYKYGRVLLWKYTKPMQPVGDEQKGEAL